MKFSMMYERNGGGGRRITDPNMAVVGACMLRRLQRRRSTRCVAETTSPGQLRNPCQLRIALLCEIQHKCMTCTHCIYTTVYLNIGIYIYIYIYIYMPIYKIYIYVCVNIYFITYITYIYIYIYIYI